jgi:hypothetical protein
VTVLGGVARFRRPADVLLVGPMLWRAGVGARHADF